VNKWPSSALLLITMIFYVSCANDSAYLQEVSDFRTMKDENFKNPASSPLIKNDLKNFKGLQYFDVNSSYKLKAKFVPASIPKYISLFESEDVKQVHVIRGTVYFKINNTSCSLLAYSSAGRASHSLFIPFTDTHKSTYPGGRYIDGMLLNDSICLLDFNLSYNPYCVYNEKYKCALVSKSNQLAAAIPAGEKWKVTH
jgi:uncharacterized protein (DUF1684 family)